MRGKIQVARMKLRAGAHRMMEHACFQIIDHDFFGRAAEGLKGMLVTGEEPFHPLAQGELDV